MNFAMTESLPVDADANAIAAAVVFLLSQILAVLSDYKRSPLTGLAHHAFAQSLGSVYQAPSENATQFDMDHGHTRRAARPALQQLRWAGLPARNICDRCWARKRSWPP